MEPLRSPRMRTALGPAAPARQLRDPHSSLGAPSIDVLWETVTVFRKRVLEVLTDAVPRRRGPLPLTSRTDALSRHKTPCSRAPLQEPPEFRTGGHHGPSNRQHRCAGDPHHRIRLRRRTEPTGVRSPARPRRLRRGGHQPVLPAHAWHHPPLRGRNRRRRRDHRHRGAGRHQDHSGHQRHDRARPRLPRRRADRGHVRLVRAAEQR